MDSRIQGGLGLGLTLSREIVRAHGGDIRVQSVVGQGSTFTVFLPAVASAAEPGPTDATGGAGATRTPGPPERTVDRGVPEVAAYGRLGGQRS